MIKTNFVQKLIRQFIFGWAILLLASACLAQEKNNNDNKRNWGIPQFPFNCEMNDAHLAQVKEVIKEQKIPHKFLILVARLGDRETKRKLNERRLYNIRFKISNDFGIPINDIISTEGERIKGFGRVEIYLNGEMIGALLVNRNGDLCVSCCGPNDNYYPYKK